MFNSRTYQNDIREMRAVIEAEADQSWRETIDRRYGLWMIQVVQRMIAAADAAFQSPAADPKKASVHIRGEIGKSIQTLAGAGALFEGSITIKDPVQAEAELRIAAAAGPPEKLE